MSAIFIISAPSGSGKSTLVNEVRQIVPGLDFSISYTTRQPRGSEQNGREYFFVTRATIRRDGRAGMNFWSTPSLTGTTTAPPAAFCARPSKKEPTCCSTLMCKVRRRSSKRFRRPRASSSFLPTAQTLEKRLRNRSQDSEQVIQRRLVTASREIERY